MSFRALASWLVLTGLGAIVTAVLNPSVAMDVLAGTVCLLCGAGLVCLDFLARSPLASQVLRRRPGSRRR